MPVPRKQHVCQKIIRHDSSYPCHPLRWFWYPSLAIEPRRFSEAVPEPYWKRKLVPASRTTAACFGGRQYCETSDAVLVADKTRCQDVKRIVPSCKTRSAKNTPCTARCTDPGVGTTALTQVIVSRSLITGQDGSYLVEFLFEKGYDALKVEIEALKAEVGEEQSDGLRKQTQ